MEKEIAKFCKKIENAIFTFPMLQISLAKKEEWLTALKFYFFVECSTLTLKLESLQPKL
jgi:hypothetical protein